VSQCSAAHGLQNGPIANAPRIRPVFSANESPWNPAYEWISRVSRGVLCNPVIVDGCFVALRVAIRARFLGWLVHQIPIILAVGLTTQSPATVRRREPEIKSSRHPGRYLDSRGVRNFCFRLAFSRRASVICSTRWATVSAFSAAFRPPALPADSRDSGEAAANPTGRGAGENLTPRARERIA